MYDYLYACYYICLLIIARILFGDATIDINLSELQHIADHLHPDECRRLVASLHFNSYEEPNSLDQAERKVPKDVPCVQMLIHWNSQAGEGRGQTHEVVMRRLNQLGRRDLADWLGRTVFNQLGKDLEHSLDDPFRDLAENDENTHKYTLGPTYEPINDSDPSEWWAIDTILYVLITGLILLTFIILGVVLFRLVRRKREKRKRTIKFASKHYQELDNDSLDSESESEDRFVVPTSNRKAIGT